MSEFKGKQYDHDLGYLDAEGKPDYTGIPDEQLPPWIRVLSNGLLFDTESGAFVKGRKPTTRITVDNAKERRARRTEIRRQAIQEGMAKAIQDKSSPFRVEGGNAYDAIAAMAQRQVEIALKKNDRNATMAFQTLLKLGDFLDRAQGGRATVEVRDADGQNILSVTDATMAKLLDAVREVRSSRKDDRPTDGDSPHLIT